jgi:hypothetical protein
MDPTTAEEVDQFLEGTLPYTDVGYDERNTRILKYMLGVLWSERV